MLTSKKTKGCIDHYLFSIPFISILFLVFSCNSSSDVDLSGVEVSLKIQRFEQDLFTSKSSGSELNSKLASTYGDFYELFGAKIINEGSVYSADFPERLQSFRTFPVHQEVWRECRKVFDSLFFYADLENALKHFKYYFPNKAIPKFYTYIGGFNQSVVIGSGFIGVGLDKYFGANHRFYAQLGLENYKRQIMYPEKIPADCILALAQAEFPNNFENESLLSVMIYEGRNAYFSKKMMPNATDTLVWGFSKEKLDYCRNYEREIWQYLINNNLLFSTDYLTIRKFTGFGPFTTAFTKESPARAACWLGEQIVAEYAETNNVPLAELMAEDDYQKILNKSRYKP